MQLTPHPGHNFQSESPPGFLPASYLAPTLTTNMHYRPSVYLQNTSITKRRTKTPELNKRSLWRCTVVILDFYPPSHTTILALFYRSASNTPSTKRVRPSKLRCGRRRFSLESPWPAIGCRDLVPSTAIFYSIVISHLNDSGNHGPKLGFGHEKKKTHVAALPFSNLIRNT